MLIKELYTEETVFMTPAVLLFVKCMLILPVLYRTALEPFQDRTETAQDRPKRNKVILTINYSVIVQ